MGIFDQFISARLLDRYPQLYQLGQKGLFVRIYLPCPPLEFWLTSRSLNRVVFGLGLLMDFIIL
jgi:hypothetical protein